MLGENADGVPITYFAADLFKVIRSAELYEMLYRSCCGDSTFISISHERRVASQMIYQRY